MWASQTESHAEDPPLRLPGWFADVLAQAPESQSSRLPAWVPRILGAQATIIDQGCCPSIAPIATPTASTPMEITRSPRLTGCISGRSSRPACSSILRCSRGTASATGRALGGLTNGDVIRQGAVQLAKVLEVYYRFQLFRHVQTSLAYQYIQSPGYNRDRGPAHVFAGRIRVSF